MHLEMTIGLYHGSELFVPLVILHSFHTEGKVPVEIGRLNSLHNDGTIAHDQNVHSSSLHVRYHHCMQVVYIRKKVLVSALL